MIDANHSEMCSIQMEPPEEFFFGAPVKTSERLIVVGFTMNDFAAIYLAYHVYKGECVLPGRVSSSAHCQ